MPNLVGKYIALLQPSSSLSPSSSDNGYTSAIIQKALSDSDLYTGFAQLRSLPTVQQLNLKLAPNQSHPLINTLDLFSYGTYADYASAQEGTYISLTDAQLYKLKALSVISAVHQNCQKSSISNNDSMDHTDPPKLSGRQRRRNLRNQEEKSSQTTINSGDTNTNTVPYSTLQSAIGIQTNEHSNAEIRQLEDLLIHCIYSNLLPSGSKLDQKRMCLICNLSTTHDETDSSSEVLCRDIHLENDLPAMIQALEVLYANGRSVESKLKNSLTNLKMGAGKDMEEWNQVDLQLQMAKSDVGSNKSNTNKAQGDKTMDSAFPEIAADGAAVMGWAMGARQVKRSRGGGNSSKGIFGLGSKR